MEAAQIPSTSTQEAFNVKTINQFEMQSYEARGEAIDVGRDYEVTMTALMALRCLPSEVEEARIAFNANGCGDFDDIVIYKIMKGGAASNITLVQLKHQIHAKHILEETFLNPKGNFSLDKYSKGFDEILNSNFNALKKMFNDNNINCNNVDLVLYTNSHLGISGQKTNQCKLLELYKQTHYLNTATVENSSIYTLNGDHTQLNKYSKDFIEMLYIFVGQVNVNAVNQLILEEIQKIVPKFKDQITQYKIDIVDNFIKFITCWSKGELGGFHVLTKARIIHELTTLLLDSQISKFITLHNDVTIQVNDEKYNRIIENFDIILVSHCDDSVIQYLRGCVYHSFNKYFQFEKNDIIMFNNQMEFKSIDFPVLNLISKNRMINSAIPLCDIYKAFWLSGYVALSCMVDNEEEYLYVSQTSSYLKSNNKCIILSKSQRLSKTQFFDNFRVLCNLNNLNSELSNMVLDEKVKFQNRGPFTFRSIVKDDIKKLITSNDIICVLNGTFCLGDMLPALPEVYIPRTVTNSLKH